MSGPYRVFLVQPHTVIIEEDGIQKTVPSTVLHCYTEVNRGKIIHTKGHILLYYNSRSNSHGILSNTQRN